MSVPTVLNGRPIADDITARVRTDVDELAAAGCVPTLATVLMSDEPAATSFMDIKHEQCEAVGIETKRIDLAPDAPPQALYDAVERVATDPDVTATFVQTPLPTHVELAAVHERVPPAKDVECAAYENLGRLVTGHPRIVPPTPAAVLRLLRYYGVEVRGQDVVVVGRTTAICKPLANLLLATGPEGDATVTVCHTATEDLAAKTRRADILVTAAGEPGLVDASMVTADTVIVDISANRVPADAESGHELVGDVAFDQVAETVRAITPVPGGVGPLTLSLLLRNVVHVTARRVDLDDRLRTE